MKKKSKTNTIYYMILFIFNVQNQQMYRDRKQAAGDVWGP